MALLGRLTRSLVPVSRQSLDCIIVMRLDKIIGTAMQTDAQLSRKAKRNRTLALLFLCLIEMVFGVCTVFIPIKDINTLSFISSILSLFMLYSWCHFDAQLRNFRISSIRVWIILFAIIVIPLYFWKTRTRREFLLNIGGLWLFLLPVTLGLVAEFFTDIVSRMLGQS
jgi:hypothetical protein